MEAQFVSHHRRGFTWRGRAIFKNRGSLTCHDRLRFRNCSDLRSSEPEAQPVRLVPEIQPRLRLSRFLTMDLVYVSDTRERNTGRVPAEEIMDGSDASASVARRYS